MKTARRGQPVADPNSEDCKSQGIEGARLIQVRCVGTHGRAPLHKEPARKEERYSL
jgi:hypothetical protein